MKPKPVPYRGPKATREIRKLFRRIKKILLDKP